MLDGYSTIQTATLQGTIKPATRPRYNAADLEDAVLAAARVSAKFSRPMYVYPYNRGYGVTYDLAALRMCESIVCVDGRQVTFLKREFAAAPSILDSRLQE